MSKISAKIQMYRLNELGDCFLIIFTAGTESSRMLIDCGSFRNGKPSSDHIKKIVGEIRTAIDGKGLDVVVATHQHNDHVSGFVHAEDEFKKIEVGQVWFSWLDHPTEQLARDIGADFNNLKLNLSRARDSLTSQLTKARGAHPLGKRSLEVLNDVLGFHGAYAAGMPPELPANGIRILKQMGKTEPDYLKPGRIVDMPGLPKGSVKIYVLGPPRDRDLLYRKDPRKGESYDHALAAASMRAAMFLNAVNEGSGATADDEVHYPFGSRYKKKEGAGLPELKQLIRLYRRREDSWRTIDDDWLTQAEALALFLDTYTNNSSLVLAIELVESKKVLLFAADAQTGNWLSWDTVAWADKNVTTDDLLARTVFYKVGHHASHNATLVAEFEKMRHPDLVAFIPVHKQDPNIKKKKGGWKMPAGNLFAKLKERTSNRVLQMDGVNPAECNPSKDPAKSSWAKAGIKPKVTNACIEIEIAG
jgi:hypothetical protein